MRTTFGIIFFINLLLLQSVHAQVIKVTNQVNSPSSFYEGEDIMIGLEVENTGKDTIKYNKVGLFTILDITASNGTSIKNDNHRGFIQFMSHTKHVDKGATQYFQRIDPKSKFNMLLSGFFYFHSNAILSQEIKTNYTTYIYIKPGNYVIHFEVNLENVNQKFDYPIQILSAKDIELNRFKDFVETINYTENQNFNKPPSAETIGDSATSTLMRFLKKYESGPYVLTASKYIFQGENKSLDDFLTNEIYVNQILDMLPTIYQDKEWMSNSFNFLSSLFIDNVFCIKVNSFSSDKEENMNEYLKKLKYFSPIFTDKIIENVSKYCDRTKLVNYAKLREQQELIIKKAKR